MVHHHGGSIIIAAAAVFLVTFVQAQTDYFWYINDIHYDPTYGSTSESCNTQVPQGDLGNYGNVECDSPWRLVQSAVRAMAVNGGGAQFIVWAGDNPPHPREGENTEETLTGILQNITALLQQQFPNTPIYPVLGNHDYVPSNQLPPSNSALYNEFTDMWEGWINDDGNHQKALETFRNGGYYTKLMPEVDRNQKIRAVVLNTNLYYHLNDQTTGVEDPAGQFTWLEDVLTQATNNGEKVHIFCHIPPGGPDFREQYNHRFVGLMQNYSSVILGIYAGHYHFDTFKVISKQGNPKAGLFISPSVTPWRGRDDKGKGGIPRNPAVRQYRYDRIDYTLEDYEQYYLPLSEANTKDDVQWSKLYTFKQVYPASSLDPDQLQAVAESFKPFASNYFHKYYEFKYVKMKEQYTPCDCACKNAEICDIENVEREEYESCVVKATCRTGTAAGIGPAAVLMLMAAMLAAVLAL